MVYTKNAVFDNCCYIGHEIKSLNGMVENFYLLFIWGQQDSHNWGFNAIKQSDWLVMSCPYTLLGSFSFRECTPGASTTAMFGFSRSINASFCEMDKEDGC